MKQYVPKSPPRSLHPAGFTQVEVLTVCGVLGVLAALFVPLVAHLQRSKSNVTCLSNLNQIGTAFQFFATDHLSTLPSPQNNVQWEDLLRPYVSRATFKCPADPELFDRLGSSYDWRDTGDPATSLWGVPLASATRPCLVLSFESLPDWHRPQSTNVVLLDGAAQTMTDDAFFSNLQMSVTPRK